MCICLQGVVSTNIQVAGGNENVTRIWMYNLHSNKIDSGQFGQNTFFKNLFEKLWSGKFINKIYMYDILLSSLHSTNLSELIHGHKEFWDSNGLIWNSKKVTMPALAVYIM